MKKSIITDHKWKQFRYNYEVPAKVMKSQFSHLSEDDFDGFIYYRKYWYHISDFLLIDKNNPFQTTGYHGYMSDSFFSGILIKLNDDNEGEYQIATYIC